MLMHEWRRQRDRAGGRPAAEAARPEEPAAAEVATVPESPAAAPEPTAAEETPPAEVAPDAAQLFAAEELPAEEPDLPLPVELVEEELLRQGDDEDVIVLDEPMEEEEAPLAWEAPATGAETGVADREEVVAGGSGPRPEPKAVPAVSRPGAARVVGVATQAPLSEFQSRRLQALLSRQQRLPLEVEEAEPAGRRGKGQAQESREELIERLLDPVLSISETATLLGVCSTSVRRYTKRGVLNCFRTPGNQRRFRLSEVLDFMERQQYLEEQ